MHCSFCLIFVSDWPTEIDKHTVAEILGDMAAISRHGSGDGVLIAAHDFAQSADGNDLASLDPLLPQPNQYKQ